MPYPTSEARPAVYRVDTAACQENDGQGADDVRGPVDHEGEDQQRHGYDDRRPHRQRQSAGHARGPRDHVADAPRERRQETEDQCGASHVSAAADGNDSQPGRTDNNAQYLSSGRPLAQHAGRDDHGEDDLGLQHQGGQTRRHAGRHRDVQEAELPERHEDSDRGDCPPVGGGRADEEDGRYDDGGEPDRREQERRDVVHAPVDDHEVETPDRGDEGGKKRVAQVHSVHRPGPLN